MLDAADGGQQMVYQVAVREEELCRELLERLRGELHLSQPRREEYKLLYAQAEAGWREAKKRLERLGDTR